MSSRPSSSLSSNTLPPPTSLLYLSSLYSLCRFYDFHAALRDSQKKRKDTLLQGLSALLGLIAMLRLRGRRNKPPLYLFLLLLYIPYIILTPTRGKPFEQQKLETSFSGGRFRSLFFRYFCFYQKRESLHPLRISLLFYCLHSQLLRSTFSTFFPTHALDNDKMELGRHRVRALSHPTKKKHLGRKLRSSKNNLGFIQC
jgi:hypothetical protein